jgi:hypothetical protein
VLLKYVYFLNKESIRRPDTTGASISGKKEDRFNRGIHPAAMASTTASDHWFAPL